MESLTNKDGTSRLLKDPLTSLDNANNLDAIEDYDGDL
jgi:hypothetical protein